MSSETVIRDPRYAPPGTKSVGLASMLRVGDRVWMDGKKQAWTVRARDGRYVIVTKPYNPQRTVLYSVIDLELGIRGTDNYHGLGYETPEDIASSMRMFEERDAEISRRNNVTLLIDRVEAN